MTIRSAGADDPVVDYAAPSPGAAFITLETTRESKTEFRRNENRDATLALADATASPHLFYVSCASLITIIANYAAKDRRGEAVTRVHPMLLENAFRLPVILVRLTIT